MANFVWRDEEENNEQVENKNTEHKLKDRARAALLLFDCYKLVRHSLKSTEETEDDNYNGF